MEFGDPLVQKFACMDALLLQSSPTLCEPMDYTPPGSSVHGILQARILKSPCPPPGDLPDPGIEPMSPVSPALAGRFFTTVPPGKSKMAPEFLKAVLSVAD